MYDSKASKQYSKTPKEAMLVDCTRFFFSSKTLFGSCLPSCILICSSQTLARLKCRLFSVDWHAARASADSFDWSPSHQMNACVSKRSFTRCDRARTHPAAKHRNP